MSALLAAAESVAHAGHAQASDVAVYALLAAGLAAGATAIAAAIRRERAQDHRARETEAGDASR